MIVLYHGSDYVFNKFEFKNVGKKSGTSGAGFGLYFSNSKADALAYGEYVYTCNVDLFGQLSNNKKFLTKQKVYQILTELYKEDFNYFENYGIERLYWSTNKIKQQAENVANQLWTNCKTDTEIIGDIINSGCPIDKMMNTLNMFGFNHTIDTATPETKTIINYILYNTDNIKIVKRESIKDL